MIFDMRGAVVIDDLLEQMNALAAKQAITVYGLGQRAQARQQKAFLG